MCVLKLSVAPYTDVPFHFIETGINVYSFEELLFHCYHNWKESLNDLEGGGVSAWVRDTLGLQFLSAQIDKLLAADEPVSEKYLKFLSLLDYFDKDDLYMLEFKIMAWENKSELEKLKQQGDERLSEGDYEKAAFYYEKLLKYGETAAVHNNIGCCMMKLGRLYDAEKSFNIAATFDKRNASVKLNLAALYLLQNRERDAEDLLLTLEKTDNDRNVQHYLGNLELRRGNINSAERYFKRSADMGNDLAAYSALCKIAMKAKDFETAHKYVEAMKDKSSAQYLLSMAQICFARGNKNEAIEFAERLVVKYFNNAEYWAFAASLYREAGKLEKAVSSIEKALELNSLNEKVVFEHAKIKKATGNELEYQAILRKIVSKWKVLYEQNTLAM